MFELFKYLEDNTLCCYELTFNEHKGNYNESKVYYNVEEQDEEENQDVDWDGNIYAFRWYDKTAVGFYLIFSNTLDGLLIKIKKLVEEIK